MTQQVSTDQRGTQAPHRLSPHQLWEELRQTKYLVEDIKDHIDNAHCNAHYECADQQYVQGQALTAQAMIAYNNMIDARIERAQRTWGMK